MVKWEYKSLSIKVQGWVNRDIPTTDLDKQFNVLGNDGWEFVESQRIDTNEWTDTIIYIFRRQKS